MQNRRTQWATLLLLAACESEVQTVGGADAVGGEGGIGPLGGASVSSTTSGEGGGCVTPCPELPPAEGEACTVACSYGDSPIFDCRIRAYCNAGSFTTVLGPNEGCGAPDASCPAEPAPGGTCSKDTARCAYADGTQCYCSPCSPGPTCGADAGDWWCGAPEPACPDAPPNYGACCESPGLECRYGYYCLGDESFVCDETGLWANFPSECPV